MRVHLCRNALVVERADRVSASTDRRAARAQHVRPAARRTPREPAVHEDPLAGRAALPRAQEAAATAASVAAAIRVLDHDQRPVAAHLEQRRLPAAARRRAPRRGRADEADAGQVGVARRARRPRPAPARLRS